MENLGYYELVFMYEMKRLSKKKIEKLNYIVEGGTSFNLTEERPSHKYMVMSKRIHPYIPCISSIYLIPNIADLSVKEELNDRYYTIQVREDYELIILLLFYTFRIKDDLKLEGSYWKRYKYVLMENKIS